MHAIRVSRSKDARIYTCYCAGKEKNLLYVQSRCSLLLAPSICLVLARKGLSSNKDLRTAGTVPQDTIPKQSRSKDRPCGCYSRAKHALATCKLQVAMHRITITQWLSALGQSNSRIVGSQSTSWGLKSPFLRKPGTNTIYFHLMKPLRRKGMKVIFK